jgi:hypothetical protein
LIFMGRSISAAGFTGEEVKVKRMLLPKPHARSTVANHSGNMQPHCCLASVWSAPFSTSRRMNRRIQGVAA